MSEPSKKTNLFGRRVAATITFVLLGAAVWDQITFRAA